MIPKDFIIEWSNKTFWQTNAQIEQDMVIERALVALFSDEYIKENLAFRGGTALHKLYLKPQSRYSEDIDLVQIHGVPFGPIIERIRDALAFLGTPRRNQKEHNNTLIFHFESEFQPVQKVRLKVETNCREHFAVMGYRKFPFEVNSGWFSGYCDIVTYTLEELLGTKFRALYQRSKGRDLYDLNRALTRVPDLDIEMIVHCFNEYMKFVVNDPPSRLLFLQNMEKKMLDSEFTSDIAGLIRPEEPYNPYDAYEIVRCHLIEKI